MLSFPKRQPVSALMIGLGIITSAVTPLVTLNSVLAQSTFYDIQGHWAKSCIVQLANQGIISGYPDGSFRPNLSMNRAEFATIVGSAFPKAVRTRKPVKFRDVPVYYWAYQQVTEASQTQFLSGYPNYIFKPNQNIHRSQVLVALASGLNYSPTREATRTLANFADANTIPVYAQRKIAAATERRLVVNYPNIKLLNPNKKATRAEVAAFLCQALVKFGGSSVIPEQYIAGTTSYPSAQKFFENEY